MDEYRPRPHKNVSEMKQRWLDQIESEFGMPSNEFKKLMKESAVIGDDLHFDEEDMLICEIGERQEWLADMEALGEGHKHRPQIIVEIKQRLKRLKEIQKSK
jgi:hypothetical protein